MFNCRYYKNNSVAVDYSVDTQLITAAEPIMSSYMEFDENDKKFKIISGISVGSGSRGRVSHDF